MRNFSFLLSAILLTGIPPAFCRADIIIDVGNPTLLANQANQQIAVNVNATGGEVVQGLNFNFELLQGGAAQIPTITALDIVGVGTIFDGNNTGQAGTFVGDTGAGSQGAFASTTTGSGTISPIGVLGFVTIDTTGITNGTYSLRMIGTINGDTDFAGISADQVSGTSLTVGVPEPSSAGLLLAVGALVLGYRRKS